MLVSIIVNCYNRADMVSAALDSVYNQTYRPLELIIIDDGSTDRTFDIVSEWKAKHLDKNDFSCIAKTFPNGKLCLARNRGLELAHGEYIQYVDDDDWLYPNAIEQKMSVVADHPDWDLIINQLDYYKNGKIINHTRLTLPLKKENIIPHLLEHECLISAVLMFKTETLRRIGGWKNGLIFADDIEITLRLAIEGGTFGLVDEHLSGCRIHPQPRQCTSIREKLEKDFCAKLYSDLYELACKRGLDTEKIRRCFAEHLRKDGAYFIKIGKYDSAQSCYHAAGNIDRNHLFDVKEKIPFSWRISCFIWRIRCWVRTLYHYFR